MNGGGRSASGWLDAGAEVVQEDAMLVEICVAHVRTLPPKK